MPELPEVETTVRGINKKVKGLTIEDVWTDYYSEFHLGKPNIKDREYFKKFRTSIIRKKIIKATRRAKNVLIHIEGGRTILVHMKMTGHLLYGKYEKTGAAWKATEAGPLRDDPYNRFIHAIFTLSDGKALALSDVRKFAKITLLQTDDVNTDPDLKNVGPEPLEPDFTFEAFSKQLLKRPHGKIKQILMDQTIIAGIGNIYSDEILWHGGVHPLEKPKDIPEKKKKLMYTAMKKVLEYSLAIGGDSDSDYRNIDGVRGDFQNRTSAYGREGEKCMRKKCKGKIVRLKVAGRSAHFCDMHQKLVEK